jgi:hypothetical protein
MWQRVLRGLLPVLAFILAGFAGCSRSNESYDPSTDKAHDALVATLDYWKSGHERNRIVGRTPFIEVVDSYWDTGVKLNSYDIGGEDTNEDGHRRFTVKLNVEDENPVQTVRYIVVGLNPLWVYREEDYKKAAGTEGM